jgi:drug/metabolite transporter (DMT)-like permease
MEVLRSTSLRGGLAAAGASVGAVEENPAPTMDRARADRLRILGAAALFSTGGAAIKAVGLTPWQTAGFRSGVAAIALLAIVPGARRAFRPATFVVGLAYAATVLLFALANRLTTSANAIFLQSTAPLHLLLLGPWLLGEPVRRRDLAFLLALAAGLAAFFVGVEPRSRTASDPRLGDALAAASGLTWALTVAGIRRLGRARETGEGVADPADAAVAATVVGNAIAFAVALPFALPVVEARPLDWALVGFLGVFQIACAYALLTRGVRTVTALETSLLLLLEPVLNPVWSWWVHGEAPGAWALAGGAVILLATTTHALASARRADG